MNTLDDINFAEQTITSVLRIAPMLDVFMHFEVIKSQLLTRVTSDITDIFNSITNDSYQEQNPHKIERALKAQSQEDFEQLLRLYENYKRVMDENNRMCLNIDAKSPREKYGPQNLERLPDIAYRLKDATSALVYFIWAQSEPHDKQRSWAYNVCEDIKDLPTTVDDRASPRKLRSRRVVLRSIQGGSDTTLN